MNDQLKRKATAFFRAWVADRYSTSAILDSISEFEENSFVDPDPVSPMVLGLILGDRRFGLQVKIDTAARPEISNKSSYEFFAERDWDGEKVIGITVISEWTDKNLETIGQMMYDWLEARVSYETFSEKYL